MTRKILLGLALGLVSMLLVGVTVNGCAQLEQITTKKYDPGLIPPTQEVTAISGSVSYSMGVCDINLAAVIVSGEALTLEVKNIGVYVGKAGTPTSEWEGVDITIPGADTTKPMDIAFILDNTSSMSDAITGSKNSIIAFANSLEAAGVDAKFGLVTFGDSPKHPTPPGLITDEGSPSYTDASYTREVMDFGTASALQTKLGSVVADGGGDAPENPLDAIMYAYNNFSWRSGAQKIFILITDVDAHQSTDTTGPFSSGGNRCTTSAEAVINALKGKAVIHVVSPNYTYELGYGLLDTRRLADGLGEGRITPESNTGGKWIKFQSSGFDLTALGISSVISRSYTLRFNYTFSAGTWYIHVLIDTNGDGVFDADEVFTLTVTSSGTAYTIGSPQSISLDEKTHYHAPPNK